MADNSIFGTSVNDAVGASISQNRPLFVFLTRDDASSAQFLESWMANGPPALDETLARFVLLKLVEGTAEYGYFQQIFTDLVVPSFYIVERGNLLSVIKDHGTPQELLQRISAYVATAGTPATIAPADPASPQASPASNTPEYGPTTALTNNTSRAPRAPASSAAQHAPVDRDHDRRVLEYRRQAAAQKLVHDQEKQRLRDLLKADQREREARVKEEKARVKEEKARLTSAKAPEPVVATPPQQTNMCTLSIKLFNGNSLIQSFDVTKTLDDVRRWLDTESGVEILPQGELVPSFATSAYPQATHYVFHCPVIPRTTYTDADEFKTLSELNLTPRSALILKPVYDESGYVHSYPNGNVPATGGSRSLWATVGSFAHALYSFFDYGVTEDHHQHDPEATDDDSSSGRSTSNSRSEERIPLSRADTPNVFSVEEPRPAPSLINFDEARFRNRSSASIPQITQVEPERPSNFNSRSSTPVSFNRPAPLVRIHTFSNDDDKDRHDNSNNGNNTSVSKNDEDK